jgi:hypothetical protein
MPRYFFDIRDKDGLHYDETGIELDDFDAALAEATRALGEMVSDDLTVSIEIRASDNRFVVGVVKLGADQPRTYRC